MKKLFLSLLTFCTLSVYAQTEIVVGDMNDSGDLTVADITMLIDAVLHPEKVRTIATKCKPDESCPSMVAGTWVLPGGDVIVLNADGTATSTINISIDHFAYYPCARQLVFFNNINRVVAYYPVLDVSTNNLVLASKDGTPMNCNYAEGPIQMHEYVDLDLTSGTLWATCNVGANTPEAPGDYFAWGETTSKTTYSWNNYFDSVDGTSSNFETYYYGGGYTTIRPEDDVVYKHWGEGWRIPSDAQMEELRAECKWTWDSIKKGYLVQGPNKNSIFLPAAGYYGTSLMYFGSQGYYWTRTLDSSYDYRAGNLHFNSSTKERDYNCHRYRGQSIRPVRARSK